jgi:hypothetical protein
MDRNVVIKYIAILRICFVWPPILVLYLQYGTGTVYAVRYWYCICSTVLVLYMQYGTGTVYEVRYWYCICSTVLVLYMQYGTGTVFAVRYWYCICSTVLVRAFCSVLCFYFRTRMSASHSSGSGCEMLCRKTQMGPTKFGGAGKNGHRISARFDLKGPKYTFVFHYNI